LKKNLSVLDLFGEIKIKEHQEVLKGGGKNL
jgi:hypothetical protein